MSLPHSLMERVDSRECLGRFEIGDKVKFKDKDFHPHHYFYLVKYFNNKYVGLADLRYGIVVRTAKILELKRM